MTVALRDPVTVQPGLFERINIPPVMRGQTLADRFRAFHSLNPHVYAAIERQALRLHAQGERRISVKAIVEDLRRSRIATTGDDWRINNSWPAFYARILVERNPVLNGLIEQRRALADREEA